MLFRLRNTVIGIVTSGKIEIKLLLTFINSFPDSAAYPIKYVIKVWEEPGNYRIARLFRTQCVMT